MGQKIKDFFAGFILIAAFFFAGSGMLEACVIRILEIFGL